MKILIVSTRPPFPVLRGDQVVLFNRIREMHARGHHVFLCYLHASQAEREAADAAVSRYCARVISHHVPLVRRLLNLLVFASWTGTPLQVALFRDARLRALVSEIVREERIDVIDCFLIRPFLAVEGQQCPVVLDLIDSMLLNVERRIRAGPVWMWPVLALERSRLRRYERHACCLAASTLVVARADQDAIGADRTFVVPLGVDGDEFYPTDSAPVRQRIVLSGNMGYHANKSALTWFVTTCWNGLRAEFPDAELCVVGKGSAELAGRFGAVAGVRFVGQVESMGEYLRTAEISIAPMKSGSGMQNKVLEAMACGIPTVVTPLGLGDIKAVHGEQTLVADSAPAFACAVRALLLDNALRARISDAALELVRNEYSWARNAKEFERIALECIASARAEAFQRVG